MLAVDIRNAYLQAPASEKYSVICGQEFGLEHGDKQALIVRVLYGGKATERDFWHQSAKLHELPRIQIERKKSCCVDATCN